MKKYEYINFSRYYHEGNWIIEVGDKKYKHMIFKAYMSELGDRGWELVSVTTFVETHMENHGIIPGNADTFFAHVETNAERYYFKREKTGEDVDIDLINDKKIIAAFLDNVQEEAETTFENVAGAKDRVLKFIESDFDDIDSRKIADNKVIFNLKKETVIEKGMFKKTQELEIDEHELEIDMSDPTNISYILRRKMGDTYLVHTNKSLAYHEFEIELRQIIEKYNHKGKE